MTRDETKQAIEVMRAYVDGASIEYRRAGTEARWRIEDPEWNWADCEYRLKPAPREFVLQLGAAGNIIPQGSLHGVVREIIHVREVLDE